MISKSGSASCNHALPKTSPAPTPAGLAATCINDAASMERAANELNEVARKFTV